MCEDDVAPFPHRYETGSTPPVEAADQVICDDVGTPVHVTDNAEANPAKAKVATVVAIAITFCERI